ncbi:cAMP-dependent protein kinase inhibitor beta isoform X2 [Sorex araneus]|nr:cAMP-dependent protein kinase inhibitor beta isoform X2 [Sorex araneus]XP_054991650.1 cAMP-dependent protein kinase inhibitor beta isoform X2 [Sorex araneus]XP_054991651.1 cAMP-dependent protein kinase inhibitor beta isoform X2 [Sorex araneus]
MKTDSSSTMTDVESADTDFASSARSGRRNAVTDIQDVAVAGETSELPVKLQALTLKEDEKSKDEETTKEQLENPPKKED